MKTTLWKIAYQPWVMRLYCWFLAIVFLIAAVPKLRAPADFAVVIGMYGLIPNNMVHEVAILLPIVELITAIGLVGLRRWAVGLAIGQLLLFIAVLAYGSWLGLAVDCGCFGPGDPEYAAVSGLKTALWRDVGLLIPGVWSWWILQQTTYMKQKERAYYA